MAAVSGTKTTVAREIWSLLGTWFARAEAVGALHPEYKDQLVLAGEEGAFLVFNQTTEFDDEMRLHRLALPIEPKWMDLTPTQALIDQGDQGPRELSEAEAQLVLKQLQPGVVEVSPRTLAPFGVVDNNRIVAIVWTSDVGRNSESASDRVELGVYGHLYVGDAEAFRRITPACPSLEDWYTRFWELKQEGRVVQLSDRFRNLTGIWWKQDRLDSWLAFDHHEGKLPAILGCRYDSWNITTNQPWQVAHIGEPVAQRRLDGWFR